MLAENERKTKIEDIYLAIIYGLKAGDKNFPKMWDRAIAIKTALNNAGFKIVKKPKNARS